MLIRWNMINNDVFTEFFKGLYIESQDVDNGGALLSLNTLSAGSNLRLYYTYMTDKDTLNRDFCHISGEQEFRPDQ